MDKQETPVLIFYKDTLCSKMELSMFYEFLDIFEMDYEVHVAMDGNKVVEVFGPNKLMLFDIVQNVH